MLLSSMGNPKPLPVYWDKILINASQVTNPPIDPLREPMETKVSLGKKPKKIVRDENGNIKCDIPASIELSMPVMFSAMSYGSISYNAHASLARAAKVFMRISTVTAKIQLSKLQAGVSAYTRIILKRVRL